jgi:excisionase family DNA binding protein
MRMPKLPHVSEDLLRTLGLVVHEWQRLEAGRSAEQVKRPRPTPPPYREPSERELEDAKDPDEWMYDYMAKERSDLFAREAELGRGRCEAGVKMWGLLRCQRSTAPGDQWCTQHHPTPPKPIRGARRLSPWDLRYRPDGDVLGAVYDLGERVEQLDLTVRNALSRLDRQQDHADAGGPAVLNTAQAAKYLGISREHMYRLCTEHRVPFARVGSRYRFRIDEIDEWLELKTLPAVR